MITDFCLTTLLDVQLTSSQSEKNELKKMEGQVKRKRSQQLERLKTFSFMNFYSHMHKCYAHEIFTPIHHTKLQTHTHTHTCKSEIQSA